MMSGSFFLGETSTVSEEERLEPGAHEKCK